MLVKKHKRRIISFVPFVLLVGVLLLIISVAFYYTSKIIISKRQNFVSPVSLTNDKDLSLQSLLYKNNVPFSDVKVASDSSYIITLKDGSEVDFSSKKSTSSQISSLQLILSRLTIEGKKFKKLDLRFDKPIIEF